jgi:hypothetical protein
LRFWDFEVKADPERCAAIVGEAIEELRRQLTAGEAG